MRIHELLHESYGDASRMFTRETRDPSEVIKYIDLFKDLSKRNLIKGQDKDIGKWIKEGWDEFKEFVDSFKSVQSKSAQKKAQKKDSIVVRDDESVTVVIPLTKEASCLYGKNTKWCTTSHDENYFDRYFYHNRDTMFYILPKNDDEKISVLLQKDDPDRQIVFDSKDNTIDIERPEKLYGINNATIAKWFSEHESRISKARDLDRLDKHVQVRLLVQFPEMLEEWPDISEEVLEIVAGTNVFILDYIDNPSEAIQLAAVGKNIRALRLIDDPTEAVQLRAVERNPIAYTIIKKPYDSVTELYDRTKED